jgi:hypothetical protein
MIRLAHSYVLNNMTLSNASPPNVTVGGAVAHPTAGSEPDVITWDLVNGTARRVLGRDSGREATPGWNTSCFSGRRFDGGFPR